METFLEFEMFIPVIIIVLVGGFLLILAKILKGLISRVIRGLIVLGIIVLIIYYLLAH